MSCSSSASRTSTLSAAVRAGSSAGPRGRLRFGQWSGRPRAPGLSRVVREDPDWLRQVGITTRGALLVRPDQIIGWRAPTTPPDPADDLTHALARVLGRTVG
ncbi:aromatic-ring hydroxylase C-terminal domain-containing protein [Nocardia sp. R16R-3T]